MARKIRYIDLRGLHMNLALPLAYLNTLTFSCIQMVLYTTIPYISEETGVATSSIIGAISVGSLIFSFMGPFWAARSDHWGRKRVLSLGMFGMFLSFLFFTLLFIFNETLPLQLKVAMVFAARIVYGLLASAIVPVSQAWQLDLIPETNRLSVLTRNSMCLNLGRILGPIFILMKQVEFEKVIYASTAWVLTLTTLSLLVKNTKLSSLPEEKIRFKELVNRWKKSAQESLRPILLAMIFTAFIGILHSFLGHHLKSVLNISGEEASLMFAKIILVLSISAVIIQQLSLLIFKSRWEIRLILGASSLVIGTIVMMNSYNEASLWVSIIFISLATAFIPPVYLSLTSRSEENTAKTNVFGKKLGLASIAHSFGYALGAGLIALSMKIKLVSTPVVVIFVSVGLLGLAFQMLYDRMSFNGNDHRKNEPAV